MADEPVQGNLFSDISEHYENTDAGVPEVPEQVAAAAPPEAPTPAPVAPAPPSVEAAAQPPAQPAQPQEVAQQPQYPTTDEILVRRQAWLEQLAKQYSIPDDQVDVLATEPHKVLPNLVANAVANTYEAVTQYFNSMMPQYITQVLQQQQAQHDGSERFFGSWPQLRSSDPNVTRTIATVAQAYRRSNPTASVEEAIDKVGAAASAMLGLPVNSAAKPPQTSRTPSAQKPFSHSGAGLAGGPPQARGGSSPQANFFEELVNGLDLSEL